MIASRTSEVSRHKCLIYDGHPSEQLPVVVPLLLDALGKNERCLYLGDSPTIAMVREALAARGVDVEAAVARGALVFSSDRGPAGAAFDPRGMVDMLVETIDGALREGFAGLCATGDMRWELGDDRNFERLLEYEALLERVFREKPLRGICQYHRSTVPPRSIETALLAHRSLYIGDTFNADNLFYVPPELLLQDGRRRDEMGAWMCRQLTRIMDAERKRDQAQQDLAITLECMVDAVITTDVDGRVTSMNPAAEALTRWSQDDARGRPLDELVRFLNQRTGEPVEHPVEHVLREGLKLGLANDTVLVVRDGTRIPVASSGAPMRDATGAIRGVVLVLKDVKEERQLTTMLQQAQKMEAIGRLAGGVAHDFNNLLTVISGYSELVLRQMPERAPFREELEEIQKAGEQAASLTRQLLAFSRRQVLQPEALDVNEIVGRMDKILRRLIGEDIDVVTRLKPRLDLVMADPGQIEQIVMNLVVNARDAMPQGGKLTLETANVELDEAYARTHPEAHPGPHVMIAVTDTGTGMDADTLARIFEPFFTTKERGKGTGLGLSTVFGIVKQSGGNIWVYSELGRGTTFKVYLPSAMEEAVPAARHAAKPSPAQGGETILVVEDNPAVRALIRSVLEKGGYRVLAAGDVDTAVDLCRRHQGDIHLLLTDVVLPKTGGREVANRILSLRSGLKVVFMSGYTDDAIVHHGVLEPGTAFIEKPVTADTLLAKVHEFLH